MELVFLPSARDDLAHLRRHYREAAPPDGDPSADIRLVRQALTATVRPRLADGPIPGLREMAIPRTPFSLTCRIVENRIEVLHIRRCGQDHSAA